MKTSHLFVSVQPLLDSFVLQFVRSFFRFFFFVCFFVCVGEVYYTNLNLENISLFFFFNSFLFLEYTFPEAEILYYFFHHNFGVMTWLLSNKIIVAWILFSDCKCSKCYELFLYWFIHEYTLHPRGTTLCND